VSSSPTRGGPMRTNGSTCRTTAASRSAPTPAFMRRRCRIVLRTSAGPERPPTSSSAISRPSQAAGQGDSRSGPLCRSSARWAWLTWSSAHVPLPSGWPTAWPPGERRSPAMSCSTRSWSVSGMTQRRTRPSAGSNATGRAGSAARPGGAGGSFACRCAMQRRLSATSTSRLTRSCGQPPARPRTDHGGNAHPRPVTGPSPGQAAGAAAPRCVGGHRCESG